MSKHVAYFFTTEAHAVQPRAPKSGTASAKATAAYVTARDALTALRRQKSPDAALLATAEANVAEAAKKALSGVKFIPAEGGQWQKHTVDSDLVAAYGVADAAERAAILATFATEPDSDSPIHPSVARFDGMMSAYAARAEAVGITTRALCESEWLDGFIVLPSTARESVAAAKVTLAEQTTRTLDSLFGAE
jgi:hypothetical protein